MDPLSLLWLYFIFAPLQPVLQRQRLAQLRRWLGSVGAGGVCRICKAQPYEPDTPHPRDAPTARLAMTIV
jgi:hypothetical protein